MAWDEFFEFFLILRRMESSQISTSFVPYSFSHSHIKGAHQIYKLSDTEVIAFMGHSVPVHNSTYEQWSAESMLKFYG